MATDSVSACIAQIGDAAGLVWHALNDNGPLSVAKLVKMLDVPRDTVMQAVGWLAREDKIDIDDTPRGRILSLRESRAD